MSLIFTVDIRRDTSRFGLCRVGAPRCRNDTDRQQMKNPLKRCFKGFCLILSSKLLDFGAENEARTRDPNLGKVVLYQLSYFRVWDCKYRAFFSNAKKYCCFFYFFCISWVKVTLFDKNKGGSLILSPLLNCCLSVSYLYYFVKKRVDSPFSKFSFFTKNDSCAS